MHLLGTRLETKGSTFSHDEAEKDMEESLSAFIKLRVLAQEVPRMLTCRSWDALSEKGTISYILSSTIY